MPVCVRVVVGVGCATSASYGAMLTARSIVLGGLVTMRRHAPPTFTLSACAAHTYVAPVLTEGKDVSTSVYAPLMERPDTERQPSPSGVFTDHDHVQVGAFVHSCSPEPVSHTHAVVAFWNTKPAVLVMPAVM